MKFDKEVLTAMFKDRKGNTGLMRNDILDEMDVIEEAVAEETATRLKHGMS